MIQSVYVIQSSIGLVKIGIASNARRRLDSLRSGSPARLSLKWSGETDAALAIEQRVHANLSAQRETGEWFRIDVTEAVVAVIKAASELGYEFRHMPDHLYRDAENYGGSGNRGRPLSVGASRAENVTIRMPPELAAAIDVVARAHGISRSDAARRLIEDGIRSGAHAEWIRPEIDLRPRRAAKWASGRPITKSP